MELSGGESDSVFSIDRGRMQWQWLSNHLEMGDNTNRKSEREKGEAHHSHPFHIAAIQSTINIYVTCKVGEARFATKSSPGNCESERDE